MKTKLLFILLGMFCSIGHLYAQIEIEGYEDRPDSVVFLSGKKDSYRCDSYKVFKYDEDGRPSYLEVFNNRDDKVHFLPQEKMEQKHDSSGRLIFFASYNWNKSSGSWVGYNQYELLPIDEGVLEKSYSYWNEEIKDWSSKRFVKSQLNKEPIGETVYTVSSFETDNGNGWFGGKLTEKFDKDGNCIFSFQKSWLQDSFNEEWVDPDYSQCETAFKHEYTYENGSLLMYTSYEWSLDQNKFIGLEQHLYEYDDQGNKRKLYYNSWNPAIDDWKNDGYADFLIRGDTVISMDYSWNAEEGNWGLESKTERVYDNFHNTVWYLSCKWDREKEIWQPTSKTEGLYDQKNRLVLDIHYKLEGNKFFGLTKSEYKYNDADRQIHYSYSTGMPVKEEPEEWTWFVQSREEVLCNDQNKPLAYVITNNNGTYVDDGEYIYDVQGRLEKIVGNVSSDEENFTNTTLLFCNHSSSLIPVRQSDKIKVFSERLTIHVQSIDDVVVEVYDFSGMRISSGVNRVNVPARGPYIVNVNGKAYKIMVSGK